MGVHWTSYTTFICFWQMVPGWTKVLFFKSGVGGGLIIASQNKTGSSVGYNYVGLVNYKLIDSGCHLGSWSQVWVAREGQEWKLFWFEGTVVLWADEWRVCDDRSQLKSLWGRKNASNITSSGSRELSKPYLLYSQIHQLAVNKSKSKRSWFLSVNQWVADSVQQSQAYRALVFTCCFPTPGWKTTLASRSRSSSSSYLCVLRPSHHQREGTK